MYILKGPEMTDAELFADRIYFTPEERRAFLRGVEWARTGLEIDLVKVREKLEDYKKENYVHKLFEKPKYESKINPQYKCTECGFSFTGSHFCVGKYRYT